MKSAIAVLVLLVLMGLAAMKYAQYESERTSATLLTLAKAEAVNKSINAREDAVHTNFKDYKSGSVTVYKVQEGRFVEVPKIYKPVAEWRDLLTKMEYKVAFEAGTERAFSGELNANKREGIYRSKVSGNDLFHSDHKFDSGTGWPSFYRPVDEKNIRLREDKSMFMRRVEVIDAVSGAHLGHVFNDGPPPTGKRYCINSAALEFVEGIAFAESPEKRIKP